MNPMASIWYGVDPLAEKYPNESVYAYTHNNPVKFVDPNGKVAWIAVGAFAGGLINAGIAAYQGKSAREIVVAKKYTSSAGRQAFRKDVKGEIK